MAVLGENKVGLLALLQSEATTARRPHPLPWRSVIAGWPVSRRERWGRLANNLADLGFAWPEDEAEAYRRLSEFEGERP